MSVSEVKRHVAFLERVHDDTLNRGSFLYLSPAMLSVAALRYGKLWLPMLVTQKNDEKGLVPPVDVAWVWHLHRLNPLGYAAFCLELFGTVLDPGASAFRLQSADDVEDGDADDCVHTRDVWSTRGTCGHGRTPPSPSSSPLMPPPRPSPTLSSPLWQLPVDRAPFCGKCRVRPTLASRSSRQP
jgi:hypothetical protein